MQTIENIECQYHLKLRINKKDLFPVKLQTEIFQTHYKGATEEEDVSLRRSWQYSGEEYDIFEHKVILNPALDDNFVCVLDILGDDLQLLVDAALIVGQKLNPKITTVEELQEFYWVQLWSTNDSDSNGVYIEIEDRLVDLVS